MLVLAPPPPAPQLLHVPPGLPVVPPIFCSELFRVPPPPPPPATITRVSFDAVNVLQAPALVVRTSVAPPPPLPLKPANEPPAPPQLEPPAAPLPLPATSTYSVPPPPTPLIGRVNVFQRSG
jgi:autotransporter family porin